MLRVCVFVWTKRVWRGLERHLGSTRLVGVESRRVECTHAGGLFRLWNSVRVYLYCVVDRVREKI